MNPDSSRETEAEWLQPAPREAAWRALEAGCALRVRGTGDLLRVQGADASDLLQRLSASEVSGLRRGEARNWVFTNDKGRVVDVALGALAEEGLWLLTGEGNGEHLRGWLERFIILEDVVLERRAQALALSALGVTAIEAITRAWYCLPPAPGSCTKGGGGIDLLFREPDPWAAQLHAVVLDGSPQATRACVDAVRDAGGVVIDDEAHARWCIEQGRLRPGPDLDDTLNPLEAGLTALISFTKGCYVGQEVIARLANYDKVRRRRAALALEGRVPGKGERLLQDGHEVGWIVSAAARGEGAEAVALALLQRELKSATELSLEGGGRARITALFPP